MQLFFFDFRRFLTLFPYFRFFFMNVRTFFKKKIQKGGKNKIGGGFKNFQNFVFFYKLGPYFLSYKNVAHMCAFF